MTPSGPGTPAAPFLTDEGEPRAFFCYHREQDRLWDRFGAAEYRRYRQGLRDGFESESYVGDSLARGFADY